jgi:hypothetical protein
MLLFAYQNNDTDNDEIIQKKLEEQIVFIVGLFTLPTVT